jgi:hypothetical protein
VELLHVTGEDEYFPLPPALRSMISTIQAVVEAGYTARRPGEEGMLERDRGWGATEALQLVGTV